MHHTYNFCETHQRRRQLTRHLVRQERSARSRENPLSPAMWAAECEEARRSSQALAMALLLGIACWAIFVGALFYRLIH